MPQEKVRVLVAEDAAMVREMIRGILEDMKHTVVGEAKHGRQAIELTQSLRPDVVLMDIMMPDMDGVEATRRIQELCPTPVVVLTAYETPELVEQVSAAGAGAYLVKPPNAQGVGRAIAIAMARFDDLMELRRLNAELQSRNEALQAALDKVETLNGLIPICASCKKIRDDEGYWHQVEVYIRDRSEAQFSHGICPECTKKLYPDLFRDDE